MVVACSYNILWPFVCAYFGLILECNKAHNWNGMQWIVYWSVNLMILQMHFAASPNVCLRGWCTSLEYVRPQFALMQQNVLQKREPSAVQPFFDVGTTKFTSAAAAASRSGAAERDWETSQSLLQSTQSRYLSSYHTRYIYIWGRREG